MKKHEQGFSVVEVLCSSNGRAGRGYWLVGLGRPNQQPRNSAGYHRTK